MRLKPSVTAAQVNEGLKRMGTRYQKYRDAKTTIFRLQPPSDIHFDADFDGAVDKKYLWALFFIGLFIIVTACVNFINLATAFEPSTVPPKSAISQSARRPTTPALLAVYHVRPLLYRSLFAVAAGYFLALAALPSLNALFKSEIGFPLFSDPALFFFLAGLLVVVVFMSGSYPGLVLSRFKPVAALKKQAVAKRGRRVLAATPACRDPIRHFPGVDHRDNRHRRSASLCTGPPTWASTRTPPSYCPCLSMTRPS